MLCQILINYSNIRMATSLGAFQTSLLNISHHHVTTSHVDSYRQTIFYMADMLCDRCINIKKS